MKLDNKMFVEIEYTGRLKEDNKVFDTTDESIAKKNDIYNPNAHSGPVSICIGEGFILKGIEDSLIGKEVGNEYVLELEAENAFGRKDAKLLQLIPSSKFREQKVQPFPGLQLNIDGMMGIVKTVSGGRILVDFNHPLSGRDMVYNVKINKVLEEPAEKVKAFLHFSLGIKDAAISIEEGKANVKIKERLPVEITKAISEKASGLIPEVSGITFTFEERENK